jgi:Rps23 Pro-64 3,4-dihydroxylase Tpa1-like proline 4-hydroxylase
MGTGQSAILSGQFSDLQLIAKQFSEKYRTSSPFPHIYFDDFFNEHFLSAVAREFPDLSIGDKASYNSPTELKLASRGELRFSDTALQLARFMNAEAFLLFLQTLTGIEEKLIPDPYFAGGGYHEVRQGGFLKIHADFNKHKTMGLDRRINVLVYLNKDWDESYGGAFELWDKKMTRCEVSILPFFNRVVIFSTTSTSYHGHPDPLTCPADRSRRSFALYYYSNGRPEKERLEFQGAHGSLFKARSSNSADKKMRFFKGTAAILQNVTPPFVYALIRKLFIKD